MSRREAIATALLIYLLSAVVRAAVASLVVFPIPEDTAYYVSVSEHLVQGRGRILQPDDMAKGPGRHHCSRSIIFNSRIRRVISSRGLWR